MQEYNALHSIVIQVETDLSMMRYLQHHVYHQAVEGATTDYLSIVSQLTQLETVLSDLHQGCHCSHSRPKTTPLIDYSQDKPSKKSFNCT
jgi:hypothetical protein